jgi:hypothetical protein
MYHQYGVALQNVFDTQIAYAVIKRQMGQGYTHAPPHTRAHAHTADDVLFILKNYCLDAGRRCRWD